MPQHFSLGASVRTASPLAPAGASPAAAQDPGALARLLRPPTPSLGARTEPRRPAAKIPLPSRGAQPALSPVPLPPRHHQPANINNNPCNSLCFYSLAFLAPALLISAPPAPKRLLKLLESGDLCKRPAPGRPCLPLHTGTHAGDGSTHVPSSERGATRPGYLKGARLGLIKTK